MAKKDAPYEMDDLDRDLIEKVREAVGYEDGGTPARDAIDEDEMVSAMRLLLNVLGLKPITYGD